MDPPTLMSDNSYNLSEIWPFPISGGGESSAAGRLEIRRPPFLADLSQFGGEAAAVGSDRDVSVKDTSGAGGGEQKHRGGGRKRRDTAEEAKSVSTSGANANESGHKKLKTSGSGDDNQNASASDEGKSGKGMDQSSKSQPDPLKDYIHVRARRGQATDSHSLAERARREKISERMNTLQDLVPGCNKVTGKALVLDEIINYIQSLQRQVEFLSMKLEAVNSRTNPGTEGYPSKDFVQSTTGFDPSAAPYGSQAPRDYVRGPSPEWLHMQIGSDCERQM